jgi:hypothetical protein
MVKSRRVLIIISFVVLGLFIWAFYGISSLAKAAQTAYKESKVQNVNNPKGQSPEKQFEAAVKQRKNSPVLVASNDPLQGLLSSDLNSSIFSSNLLLAQAVDQPIPNDLAEPKFMYLAQNVGTVTISGTWRIRNNSNVMLAEVLRGEAVLTCDPQTGENHQGKTTANNDQNRGLDYVQKMINHIIVPLRTSVRKENQENTITPDGIYGDQTVQALQALIEGGIQTIGDKCIILVTGMNINHKTEKANAPKTFLKLVKDYSGLKETDIGKVIDQEVLVGLVNTLALQENDAAKDKHPINNDDIGIYELYDCDDWDGDGISNYIEVESSGDNGITFNPLMPETNANVLSLINTVSRGFWGHGELVKAEAVGVTTSPVPQNQRSNGLRLPHQSKGYYQFRGGDAVDTDNYAILSTLQKFEAIGRKWAERHPDLAPLNKDAFLKDGGNSGYDPGGSGGIRFGVGDLSLAKGGPACWLESGVTKCHNTHQNGLDADVRYMRKESIGEGTLDIATDKDNYDIESTKELMSLFAASGVDVIYISPSGNDGILDKTEARKLVTFNNGAKAFLIKLDGHDNHFHVRFPLTNPPMPDIHLVSSASTVPANGQSTVTITSDVIKDRMGWPLLSGLPLPATTTLGSLPGGSNVIVNSEGKVVFTFKAGNQTGTAVIRVYVGRKDGGYGIPEGILGEVSITLVKP